ncbi:MAG: hypothetical protein ABI624_14685 [Casimicrobiaceae bacterium]
MSEPTGNPKPRDTLRRPTLRMWLRFNPGVLVFAVAVLCGWPAVVGLVVAGIHTLWSGSYAQVDYVMIEARENSGYPYISGTLGATGEEHLVSARKQGEVFLVGDSGNEAFAAGKTIKLWLSPSAPDIVIQGERTNGVPVSALPERPGVLALLGYVAWLLAVVLVAGAVAGWLSRRVRREYQFTVS